MQAIGVDIGGTFTDTVVVTDEDVHAVKTSSTADVLTGLSRGIIEACDRAAVDPADIDAFSHGSTIAVNALIEETGAKTAVVTTEGFADVLEIREGHRGADLLYAPCNEYDAPLVPRRYRYGIEERIDADGNVRTALDIRDVDRVVDDIVGAGIESVAICLLHAYRNPEHENRVAERFQERAPGIDVSRSSRVSPEIREYSRTATTAADAYLKPELSNYLDELEDKVSNLGLDAPIAIMKSDGGLARPAIAADRPVTQVISGPVAGINAASFLASQRGLDDVLTFDMGGTSSDAAIVVDGNPVEVSHREIRGLKINGPFTKIKTVGAGGGSIARVDDVGALKLGPESAGADPGPACYGRGGTQPTVTDADLLLGILNADTFAGGSMTLNREAAYESVRAEVAEPMKTDVESAALSIREVIDTEMASAIRVAAVNEGFDPREFALIGFGGAGPAHACSVAAKLGIDRVVFPSNPGVFSSLGLLVSDIRHEYIRSIIETVDAADPDHITETIDELVARGHDELEAEGVPAPERTCRVSFDMMYQGQAHYLNVPIPATTIDSETLVNLTKAFEQAHQTQYGFTDERNPVELVNVRVTAVGATADPDRTPGEPTPTADPTDAKQGTREVVVETDIRVETPYYDSTGLQPGHELTGPAIIDRENTTMWIPPAFDGRIDQYGNLVATRGDHA